MNRHARIPKFYMDTDSIAVPPHCAQPLQEYFRPLNPYAFDAEVLKLEKHDLWFYGISSKRYCLYEYDGKNIVIHEIRDDEDHITERGYMLHGLGHLKDPFNRKDDWHKEVWHDILELHYTQATLDDLREKYQKYYAVSSLTVSTPSLRRRFKHYNKNRPREQQIRPFNFFLVGVGAQEGVKPIAPYNNDSQEAPYNDFIDYETGQILQGEEYWADLWYFIQKYLHHPESKFTEQPDGWLERQHITAHTVARIGKETRNIDTQFLKTNPATQLLTQQQKREHILQMTEHEALHRDINRSTFYSIKQRIRKDKKINWNLPNIQKLLK